MTDKEAIEYLKKLMLTKEELLLLNNWLKDSSNSFYENQNPYYDYLKVPFI